MLVAVTHSVLIAAVAQEQAAVIEISPRLAEHVPVTDEAALARIGLRQEEIDARTGGSGVVERSARRSTTY